MGEEAGCPFKHHSRACLRQLLQPSSESVLDNVCSLADAEDFTGACRFYLESLTVDSYSDVCNRHCSSLHTAVKAAVPETVNRKQTGGQHSDMEVEETSDSGYGSAQSYQPVLKNFGASVLSSQSNESTTCNTLSCNARNTAMAHVSHSCQPHVGDLLPSNLNDHSISNIQDHIVGSHYGVVPQRKLHAPVDFYTSFNFLATGLQSLAAS